MISGKTLIYEMQSLFDTTEGTGDDSIELSVDQMIAIAKISNLVLEFVIV